MTSSVKLNTAFIGRNGVIYEGRNCVQCIEIILMLDVIEGLTLLFVGFITLLLAPTMLDLPEIFTTDSHGNLNDYLQRALR